MNNRIVELDGGGAFICDFIKGVSAESLPADWTSDICPDGFIAARYTGVRGATGEWRGGGWIDDKAITPEQMAEILLALQLSTAQSDLYSRNRQASAQVAALQGRVDSLNDAVDLEMATPEEEAELPARISQLKTWKTYRVLLGRVNTKPTWPASPEWPEVSEPYTEEMSMTAPVIS